MKMKLFAIAIFCAALAGCSEKRVEPAQIKGMINPFSLNVDPSGQFDGELQLRSEGYLVGRDSSTALVVFGRFFKSKNDWSTNNLENAGQMTLGPVPINYGGASGYNQLVGTETTNKIAALPNFEAPFSLNAGSFSSFSGVAPIIEPLRLTVKGITVGSPNVDRTKSLDLEWGISANYPDKFFIVLEYSPYEGRNSKVTGVNNSIVTTYETEGNSFTIPASDLAKYPADGYVTLYVGTGVATSMDKAAANQSILVLSYTKAYASLHFQ